MPLYFPTNRGASGPFERVGERANTGLIHGNHDTPNTQFILDPELPVLFNYPYGGPGQQNVVVPKGIALALTGERRKDFDTGRMLPVVTIADGEDPTHRPIGLAPYNLIRGEKDRLEGNKPVVINDKYVELPYIPDEADAALCHWGAVVGAGIKPGDWLKPATGANKGKLTKWNRYRKVRETFTLEGDSVVVKTKFPVRAEGEIRIVQGPTGATAQYESVIELRLGGGVSGNVTVEYESLISDPVDLMLAQVWEAELDQEPWGWLKWVMWDERAMMEDYHPKFGEPAEDGSGYPFNPDYKKGVWNTPGYLSQYTTNPTGVPGLLDGGKRSYVSFTIQQDVNAAEGQDMVIRQFTQEYILGKEVKVEILVGDRYVLYDPEKVVFDPDARSVTITFDKELAERVKQGKVTGRIWYNTFYGTPTGWDLVGSVGALRLLLQR